MVDANQVSCYRLGIRVTQVILIHEHVRGSLAPDDVAAMSQALTRLQVAYEVLTRTIDLGALKLAGQQLVSDMREVWRFVSNPEHDIPPYSSLDQKAKELEILFHGFLQGLQPPAPSYMDWFNLGLEVARTWYSPPPSPIFRAGDEKPLVRLTRPAAQTGSLLSIPVLVGELCHRLNVQQHDVLPEVEGDGPYEIALPNLPACSYAPAWIRIEAGMAKLSEAPDEKPSRRRTQERDHLFLAWFEDKTSNTYKSHSAIRSKWNEAHPREVVTVDVVKKAIKKARKERQSSQSPGNVPA
jgi:hypothetical protein